MRRIFISLLCAFSAVAVALALAACGASHHRPPSISSPCPPNRSVIGCSVAAKTKFQAFPGLSAPAGALIPDVSVWQGPVDWGAIARWQAARHQLRAGIFKLGEVTLDSQALRNAAQTARLHFWRAAYWFLRNVCAGQVATIIWAARRTGVRILALDAELPEARGCVARLVGPLRRAGLIVIEYTSPGTNPDGSSHPAGLGTWGAAFGPNRPCLPWGCSLLAWQFTDGRFGAVVPIPTLGKGDVSVDLGITRLGRPSRLVCFGAHAQRNVRCRRIRAQVASWARARDASARAFRARRCDVLGQRDRWYATQIAKHPGDRRTPFRRRALTATRRVERLRACSTFDLRERVFAQKVNQTMRRYS